jgi:hypothetical protein
MPDLLAALEAQRATIQQEIGSLGDMRSGSITTTGGRCGNSRCRCRQKGDPGHGPFYRLTRKSPRQDGDVDLLHSGGPAQGPTGGRGVSPFPRMAGRFQPSPACLGRGSQNPVVGYAVGERKQCPGYDTRKSGPCVGTRTKSCPRQNKPSAASEHQERPKQESTPAI